MNQGFGNNNPSNFGMGNVPLPQTGSGISGVVSNRKRWDDGIKYLDFPDKMRVQLRFFGPVFVTYSHWIKMKNSGTGKNAKKFPLNCPAYDSSSSSFIPGKCPIEDDFNVPLIVEEAKRKNPNFNEEQDPDLNQIKEIKAKINGLAHCIVRNSHQFGDPNVTGKPWHPVRLGPSLFFSLVRLKKFNVCEINGKQYEADVFDPYWGKDVQIVYDSSERNPQMKYNVQILSHPAPLTEMEQQYISQLYNWERLVEFSNYDEVKQALRVNDYYLMLDRIMNPQTHSMYSLPTYNAPEPPRGYYPQQQMMQQMPQQQMPQQMMPQMPQQQMQQMQMPQYSAPQPAPSAPFEQAPQAPQVPQAQQYGAPTMQMPQNHQMPQQQQMQQMQQMQMPQQQFVPPSNFPQQGQFAPQTNFPGQQPQFAQAPNMSGLTPLETPTATPVPNNVAPPLGYNTTIPVGPEEELEIPFDDTGRTFPLKGKEVGKDEFEVAVKAFAASVPRGNPVHVSNAGELTGVSVLACYGSYQGDTTCIKCPLRRYCVHV